MNAGQTTAAIIRATNTWEGANCSELGLTRNFPPNVNDHIGFITGGLLLADVQHAGWFTLGSGILGVTFTFVWVDEGVPTDIDNNGNLDTAFREIYYSSVFSWADDGASNFDVETVALHEIGHGLSQGHFGKVMFKNGGALKASPRAVMNALYTGPYRDLAGTDNGGHCSNWAQWPNN